MHKVEKQVHKQAPWHTLDAEAVLERMDTDANRGLTEQEASRRLAQHGPNELLERGLKSPWRILWEQLTGSMVVILILAAIISYLLGDRKDAAAILIIVVLNALLGLHQEYKAERAMAALKALAVPNVKVLREGNVLEISARRLVPGDIVLLEAGNLVSADGRLLQRSNLKIQEAALTGESEAVEKDIRRLQAIDPPLGDRRNMVYMGTMVASGRGRAVVTQTGMHTQLGRIAAMLQTVQSETTPLQQRLNQLGRKLAIAALVLVAVVFALGLLRGGELKLMFLVAVSMAVAAVPEGLPAVVTIALALGSQRMLGRKALIRKLPAVETLGSVTVICSDKTGTLTENRMTVTTLDVSDHQLDLQTLVNTFGSINTQTEQLLPLLRTHPPTVTLLLIAAALCNDAELKTAGGKQGENLRALGDPTEGALVLAAARMGIVKAELERTLPRVAELPFDSDRKRMTTLHELSDPGSPLIESVDAFSGGLLKRGNTAYISFTKGAVDSVLSISRNVLVEDRIQPLNELLRNRIVAANDRLAQNGMRVLGLACQWFAPQRQEPEANLERDLTFIGLAAMIDPARPEVKKAVAVCKSAGIRPVMITGDHPLTARYIANELDIDGGGRILTGTELNALSQQELETIVEEVSVYARVSPEHKLKIVQALQNRNHIVAMTGDGVNDAPALKKADIGVAMGITGTDVAKEVADMVLLNDNFATIVAAVEEGRVIYDNIRKFIKYTLTSNSGEIWVMLLAPFLGMPLPLMPLQILWINLLTDGLPGLAFGVEPAEPDAMDRPPFHPSENIFGRGMGRHILWVGFFMGLVPLLTGYWYWSHGLAEWRTMLFTILTFAQLSHAMAIRSSRYSLFTIGLISNKPLVGAVLFTYALQLAAVYVPFLQPFFRTAALPPLDLAFCFAISTLIFWAVELEKLFLRRSISKAL